MHRVGNLRFVYQGSQSTRLVQRVSQKCKHRLLRSSRGHRAPPHKAARRRERQLRRLQSADFHLREVEMTVHRLTVAALTEMSERLTTVNGPRMKRYRDICGRDSRGSTSPDLRQQQLHLHHL